MKIAMLSPYSLTRPGGVQGQAIGLARALRALGHEVTVAGPGRRGHARPHRRRASTSSSAGRRPSRSNGSVAPVALWPAAAARAERFVRAGGFDVLHVHEPLAPMAALRPRAHRAAPDGRHVPPGRREPVGAAAQAAGGTGGQPDADQGGGVGGGPRDGRPFERRHVRGALQRRRRASASSRPSPCTTSRAARPSCSSGGTSSARA